MSIARDEVAHLARLSRLALGEEELDHFAGQLDQIISAVARVQEVAAERHPADLARGAAGQRVPGRRGGAAAWARRQALGQAPAVEQQRFRVPRILAED